MWVSVLDFEGWVDEGGLWGGGDIIQMMYQPGWFRERDPR